MDANSLRLGIDLGGTKIEGVVLDADGRSLAGVRIPSPRGDYPETLDAIARIVARLEAECSPRLRLPVGIGIPGSISPRTSRVQNANSTWLNGQSIGVDLERHLGRPVRVANDANCFVLSEVTDGAAAGVSRAFGVILGTGCGGGIVSGGRLIDGPRGIGGEWGHNPLPWAEPEEYPGPLCWCGRLGCIEAWVSGPALARDHERNTSEALDAETISARALSGDVAAQASLDRHAARLARGLAVVVNLIDPDVIVLGGGLSRLRHLYTELPRLMSPHIFSDTPVADIRPPRWGDASGVRGAARLWPAERVATPQDGGVS